jgi:UDPglucose 6-dehydrogenase
MSKISFIGLGKLGLPLATCLAKNGHSVIGIDVNESFVNDLNKNSAPFYETDLQKNIDLAKDKIFYSLDYDLVKDTDATIILVNTPSNKKDGSFSNLYIEKALEESCKRIKNKASYHLFVISSTVMPGSIQDSFIPLIESTTGWQLNKQYGICYIPDFVALGTIIKDFENPELVVLGQSDQKAGDKALDIYSKVFVNNPPIKRMSLIEAEIAKISLNAFICTKISFSNFLTRVCEKHLNVNVDNITDAIGIDKRISPYYFKGGLSFGGTCFPRDTWAFMKMSEKLGLKAYHIEAAEKINQEQDRHLLDKVLKVVLDNKLPNEISILGLGFKNNTPVINESASIKLIEKLLNMNYKIHVYDPVGEAVQNTKQLFSDKIVYHNSAQDCVKSTKLCLLVNHNKQYKDLENWSGDGYVIDCWRSLTSKSSNIYYLGK